MYCKGLLLFFLFPIMLHAQEMDLFQQIEAENPKEAMALLPDNMLFSQGLLWGKKGILRTTGVAPLALENREKELKIRRTFLTAHQLIGYATLAGMIAQGILGTQLYNGKYKVKEVHEVIGNLTSVSYFTGASLSLFAPPPLTNEKTKGLSSIKAHKYLATLHFTGMIATNVLAEDNKKLHRAAAFTTFASYAAAVLVFKF